MAEEEIQQQQMYINRGQFGIQMPNKVQVINPMAAQVGRMVNVQMPQQNMHGIQGQMIQNQNQNGQTNVNMNGHNDDPSLFLQQQQQQPFGNPNYQQHQIQQQQQMLNQAYSSQQSMQGVSIEDYGSQLNIDNMLRQEEERSKIQQQLNLQIQYQQQKRLLQQQAQQQNHSQAMLVGQVNQMGMNPQYQEMLSKINVHQQQQVGENIGVTELVESQINHSQNLLNSQQSNLMTQQQNQQNKQQPYSNTQNTGQHTDLNQLQSQIEQAYTAQQQMQYRQAQLKNQLNHHTSMETQILNLPVNKVASLNNSEKANSGQYTITNLAEQVGILLQNLSVIGDNIDQESQKSRSYNKNSSAIKSISNGFGLSRRDNNSGSLKNMSLTMRRELLGADKNASQSQFFTKNLDIDNSGVFGNASYKEDQMIDEEEEFGENQSGHRAIDQFAADVEQDIQMDFQNSNSPAPALEQLKKYQTKQISSASRMINEGINQKQQKQPSGGGNILNAFQPHMQNNGTGQASLSKSGNMSISSTSVSPFESSSRPGMPAGLYFQILVRKLKMPDEHTVCVLVLINRICNLAQQNFERIYCRSSRALNTNTTIPVVNINSLTIHRLILVAVLTIHKYYTDPFYLNSYMSYIGGVQLQEINFLEEEFLDIIDFNLSVETQEYDTYLKGLKAFFASPLQPETIAIIEEISSAFQHQQQLSQKFLNQSNSLNASLSLKLLQQQQFGSFNSNSNKAAQSMNIQSNQQLMNHSATQKLQQNQQVQQNIQQILQIQYLIQQQNQLNQQHQSQIPQQQQTLMQSALSALQQQQQPFGGQNTAQKPPVAAINPQTAAAAQSQYLQMQIQQLSRTHLMQIQLCSQKLQNLGANQNTPQYQQIVQEMQGHQEQLRQVQQYQQNGILGQNVNQQAYHEAQQSQFAQQQAQEQLRSQLQRQQMESLTKSAIETNQLQQFQGQQTLQQNVQQPRAQEEQKNMTGQSHLEMQQLMLHQQLQNLPSQDQQTILNQMRLQQQLQQAQPMQGGPQIQQNALLENIEQHLGQQNHSNKFPMATQWRNKDRRLSSAKGNACDESQKLRNNLDENQLAQLMNPILKNHICAEHIDKINTNNSPPLGNAQQSKNSNPNSEPSNGANPEDGSQQQETIFHFPEYKITHLN